jgi:multidrug efflux pump subunit AcrA (membrane-fusion protein)
VPFGCLVAEQIGDELASTDMHARCEVVARHASTALWNASEHDKAFLPLLKAIGSPWRFFRGRTLAKIIAVLVAIVGIVCILAFVPWELTIEGKGSLRPLAQQIIYAPSEAIIVKVPIDHATHVEAGDLLAQLDSRDLEKELRRLTGEEQAARIQESSAHNQAEKSKSRSDEYNGLKGQEQEARVKAESARKQIDIIKEQLALLEVRSPIKGIVTTWDPKKELMGRPVQIGQELLQVAALDGDLILEVDVPDDDMGPILEAQSRLEAEIAKGTKPQGSTLQAYFVIATDPKHRYRGFVRRIASSAETVETKHVVKLTVGFSDKVRDEFLSRNKMFKPGSEVRARIECGQAKLAYVLLRDVVHVFYETILFRWPFIR